jgi:hypothetical protein
LASSFAACQVPEAATMRALQALLANTQTTDSARIARRNTELGKLAGTVRSGYEKFAPKMTVFDPWARHIVPASPLDILPSIHADFVGSEAAVIGCDPSCPACRSRHDNRR